jgi:hypothetical protein
MERIALNIVASPFFRGNLHRVAMLGSDRLTLSCCPLKWQVLRNLSLITQ